MKSINQAELVQAIQAGKRIIDVREADEYVEGHVPTAINIPMSQLQERFTKVENGDYIICHSGARSANSSLFLEGQGIEVINVSGGTSAWTGQLEY